MTSESAPSAGGDDDRGPPAGSRVSLIAAMSSATHSVESHAQRQPWAGRPGKTAGQKLLAWFEDVIWHDRHVCSHCFQRLRRTADLEADEWGNIVTVSNRTDAAVHGHKLDHPPDTVVSDIPLARPRVTCGNCGSVGGLAQGDTLSEQAAVDRVPALIERVRERGHAIDEDVVYDVVRHLKTSDYRNDDKRVFAAAVGVGIRRG